MGGGNLGRTDKMINKIGWEESSRGENEWIK
jgi:hypothetical protein